MAFLPPRGVFRKVTSSLSILASSSNGYYGDAAVTVPVGKISPEAEKLLRVTRESLDLAIEKVRPGNRLSDISAAVQTLGRTARLFGGA